MCFMKQRSGRDVWGAGTDERAGDSDLWWNAQIGWVHHPVFGGLCVSTCVRVCTKVSGGITAI